MGGDGRWEFRRKNNDDDSSSDESKSSSEAAHKKHKLVSSFISGENDEENMSGKGKSVDKGTNVHSQRSGKNSSIHHETKRVFHEGSRKKSKTSVYEPAAMDEFKRFMESLLEDLKVTRENLLSWMRQEMQKLVEDDTVRPLEWREGSFQGKNLLVQHGEYVENTTFKKDREVNSKRKLEENILIHHQRNSQKVVVVPHGTNLQDNVFARHHNNLMETNQAQHQNNFEQADVQVQSQSNFESGMRAQTCNVVSSEGTTRSNQATGYDNGYQVLGEQVDNGQAIRALIPREKFNSFVKPNLQSFSKAVNVQMQHQTNYLLGMRPQNYSFRSLDSPLNLNGNERAQSNNFPPWIGQQVDYVRDVGPVAVSSSEIERGAVLTVPTESSSSANVSSQVASSMYLSLPSVLTRPYGEEHILGTSSSSYTQPTVAGSRLGINYEKASTMLKGNSHYGNFTGMSHQVRNGSIAQIGSQNVGYIDRQSIPSSSIGTGFPVAQHLGMDMDTSISFLSQASTEYLPRDDKNIRGLRLNDRVKMLSGGRHAAPEDYVSNKVYSPSISKPQGTLQAFQRENLEKSNMFPK